MESFDTWTMVCRRKLRENLAWQKILGHLPEKRRRMCAINKPELAKKPFCDALMRVHRRAFVIIMSFEGYSVRASSRNSRRAFSAVIRAISSQDRPWMSAIASQT